MINRRGCVLGILLLLLMIIIPYRMLRGERISLWLLTNYEIAQLERNVEKYQKDTQSLPNKLSDLIAEPLDVTNWQGPYLKRLSYLKDLWGEPYQYEKPGPDGTFYRIWSKAHDRAHKHKLTFLLTGRRCYKEH